MRFDDWFLTPDERGNPSTEIDRRRGGHVGWTENNHVAFLIDGATYFTQLAKAFEPLERLRQLREVRGSVDQKGDVVVLGPSDVPATTSVDLGGRIAPFIGRQKPIVEAHWVSPYPNQRRPSRGPRNHDDEAATSTRFRTAWVPRREPSRRPPRLSAGSRATTLRVGRRSARTTTRRRCDFSPHRRSPTCRALRVR